MMIILKLVGAAALITAIMTFAGMKFAEWWECGK